MRKAREVRIHINVDAGKYPEGFFPVYRLRAVFPNGKSREETYVYVAHPYESREKALARAEGILLPVTHRLRAEWELQARKVHMEAAQINRVGAA
jgi:hypothetical protein